MEDKAPLERAMSMVRSVKEDASLRAELKHQLDHAITLMLHEQIMREEEEPLVTEEQRKVLVEFEAWMIKYYYTFDVQLGKQKDEWCEKFRDAGLYDLRGCLYLLTKREHRNATKTVLLDRFNDILEKRLKYKRMMFPIYIN